MSTSTTSDYSGLIPLWTENRHCMISILLNLLRYIWWPRMWSILLSVPCELEMIIPYRIFISVMPNMGIFWVWNYRRLTRSLILTKNIPTQSHLVPTLNTTTKLVIMVKSSKLLHITLHITMFSHIILWWSNLFFPKLSCN